MLLRFEITLFTAFTTTFLNLLFIGLPSFVLVLFGISCFLLQLTLSTAKKTSEINNINASIIDVGIEFTNAKIV